MWRSLTAAGGRTPRLWLAGTNVHWQIEFIGVSTSQTRFALEMHCLFDEHPADNTTCYNHHIKEIINTTHHPLNKHIDVRIMAATRMLAQAATLDAEANYTEQHGEREARQQYVDYGLLCPNNGRESCERGSDSKNALS